LQAKKKMESAMIADTNAPVVGSFADSNRIQDAVDALRRAGFRGDQIIVIRQKEESRADATVAVLTELGLSHSEAKYYQKACDSGRTLVMVDAENRYQAAQLILNRNGSSDPYPQKTHPEDEGPRLVGNLSHEATSQPSSSH
jgi:hypothetical protein